MPEKFLFNRMIPMEVVVWQKPAKKGVLCGALSGKKLDEKAWPEGAGIREVQGDD